MTSPELIDVFGAIVAVEVEEADRERIRSQWSRCLADTGLPADAEIPLREHIETHRRDYQLATELTLAGIRQSAGSRLMLHAAGVADLATGSVIALVAPSGTGKTTAARWLCRNGFGYVSDETVVISTDLTVTAYPKPLSVVIDPAEPTHKRQESPDALGLLTAPVALRLSTIVLLDRDPDAGEPEIEQLALADGLLALIPQTSALPAMDHPLGTLAGLVVAAGGVLRLRYRDIDQTADILRSALATPRVQPEILDQLHPAPGSELPEMYDAAPAAPAPTAALSLGSTVTRLPYTDAIAIDESIVVLVGSSTVVLDGLGSTIWRHCERPVSADALVDRCRQEHGDHADATHLVLDAIEVLYSSGLLQYS
ncbi:hypothetical protein [Rudaeicoccus suwonensis]|nr:hypothetical protein [Rudaeicoccus suwonensis]